MPNTKTPPTPMCCHPECAAAARWAIYQAHAPDALDTYLHACTAHVGALLGDALQYNVFPLKAVEAVD